MGGLHYVLTYVFLMKAMFKYKTGPKNKAKWHK